MALSGPPVVYQGGTWHTTDHWDPRVNGVTLHIPAGTTTDLASVPRFLWPLIAPMELGGIGCPLIHDWIYRHRGLPGERRAWTPAVRVSRRAADRIFREAMRAAGVGWVKRWVAWAGVRLGGWVPWPPTPSMLRSAAVRSLHTAWQTGLAILIGRWANLGIWGILAVAAGLSLVKSLLVVPAATRAAGGIYR